MNPATSPGNRGFFYSHAAFVVRWRIPLLLLTIAVTVGAVWMAKNNLKIEADLESLAPKDAPESLALEAFRDVFGRDDVFILLAKGDVFSMGYAQKLRDMHQELEQIDVKLTTDAHEPTTAAPGGPAAAQAPGAASGAAAEASPTGADEDFAEGGDDFGGDELAGEDGDAWEGEKGGSVVDEVVSLFNARRTSIVDGALKVGELMAPFPTKDQLPALKDYVLGSQLLMGQVIGAKAAASVVMVRTHPMSETDSERVYHAVKAVMKRYDSPDFELSMAGSPALVPTMKGYMIKDLKVLLGGSFFIMFLVLAFMFRHPLGVVPPILVVAISVIWTFGAMALAGMPMTLISNIMPSFLVCVGLGAAIHIISVYRDERLAGLAGPDAVVAAVGMTGKPVVYTALTTMVGLLSFRFASVDAIAQMGVAGAFGVGVACIHSLVFLPIALSFNKKSLFGRSESQQGDFLDRFLNMCSGFSTGPDRASSGRRNLVTLVVGGALLALAIFGTTRLYPAHDPLAWMPDDQPIKQAFDYIDSEIGGTANVQLLIESRSDKGVTDLKLLQGLEALQEHVAAYKNPRGSGKIVGHAMSVLDVIKETNRATNGGDEAFYKLPDSQRGASDLMFMFESAGAAQLRRLVTTDMSTTQMSIRIKWMDANSYTPLAAHIQEGVAKHLSGVAKVRPTGAIFTLLSVVSRLVSDVLSSFGAAFVVITIFMVMLLRDFRLGLIAMVPNFMPIIFIAGIMGLIGIPIDMGNLMIASIAIGIAVDDTIHFLHHFQHARAHGQDVEQAIAAALRHCGRAIVSTSLVLALGFSVYLTATMYHLQRFGSLIAMVAIMALLTNIIIGPAMLRRVYGLGRDA